MNEKLSYAVRAAVPAAAALIVYLVVFLLFLSGDRVCIWIGFGFAVLSILLTGAGIFLAVSMADSLQTAVNLAESLRPLWIYPVASVVASIVGGILPLDIWRIMLCAQLVILAAAIILAVYGVSAAARMTQLDRRSREIAAERKNRGAK